MPELPEVEHFRRLLLPLVSDDAASGGGLEVECPPPIPTRNFPDPKELSRLADYRVDDVKRKGKLIRMDLALIEEGKGKGKGGGKKRQSKKKSVSSSPMLHLYLHMGMTGRISTPTTVVGLESLSGDDEYPPPHTHLVMKSNGHEASFSDPRRFGVVTLTDPSSSSSEDSEEGADQFADLAPDAMDELEGGVLAEGLAGKRKGIKSLLLDQKAVVSGVGNWVADEVLYQSTIHPDQTLLTTDEVRKLGIRLRYVFKTAVECMSEGRDFPQDWIFHHRWSKGKGKATVKDSRGRNITFLQSGGRTSAVVPSIQKIKSRKKATASKKGTKKNKATKEEGGNGNETGKQSGGKGAKGRAAKKRLSEKNANKSSGGTAGGKRQKREVSTGLSAEDGSVATPRRRSPRRS